MQMWYKDCGDDYINFDICVCNGEDFSVCWYKCVKHEASKYEAECRFEHYIKFFNLDASKKGLRRVYINGSIHD